MKKLLLIGALVLAGLAAPALAGDSRAQKNWGTQVGGSGSPTSKIYELNVIADQTEGAIKGTLGSGVTYNSYTNIAVGNWTQVDINGNNNNVGVDANNTGNTTAGQTNGGGGIKQTIGQ